MTAAITDGGQHGQDPDATATVRTPLVEQPGPRSPLHRHPVLESAGDRPRTRCDDDMNRLTHALRMCGL